MRRPCAAHSVACKHHEREIQLGSDESLEKPRKLLTRLPKTQRRPTTGFALLGAHQIGLFSRNTLICKSICFLRDSTESLVYDVLQLNVLHTGRLMFQLARYWHDIPV
ncbi:hypothetical protein T265_03190 [Opisthorchis viverrini]|uniref:Uncharacterized protein n=1 Tax=Opisthorchis viverrini TaxID=6198 RepID=A0A074ZTA4_OPIVI|nr:hypothetical protein T265_03190 [Opisthorchis viverrini]KER30346.1 hypothetical protein T265_03190 [Opisthorchis viverrini]